MQLTDRQQLLFDRLVTLGDWATNGELPLRVLEIRGFGSFFRGKPRPSDVDLILRVQRPDHLPEFDRFIKVLNAINYDWKLAKRFPTPKDALAGLREDGDSRCADVVDEEHRKFSNWVEAYSWKMLRPDTFHGQCSFEAPEGYAKRMVKRHLPNLNIIHFQNPSDEDVRPLGLRCGFTVSIWKSEATDTAQNLRRLLSEEIVTENLLRELAYFDIQIPEVEALTRLYEAEIELLNRIPRRRKKPQSSWKWFEKFSDDHADLLKFQQQLKAAQKASERFDKEEWGRPPNGKVVSLSETAKEADQARKRLKQLYQRNEMLESIRDRLAHFKSGRAETDLPAKEYVVDELLNDGSQKAKEKVAAFLRTLGYPVDRVLRRNERDFIEHRRRVVERWADKGAEGE